MSGHGFDKVYAGAYDALYQDKDYEAECDFLEQVFARRGADSPAFIGSNHLASATPQLI